MKFLPEKETLEKIQIVATILSLIAVPCITAWFGYKIQEDVSTAGIKKDYVQMAVNILAQPKKPNDNDLRKWSVDVLSKNSPVPFTQTLSKQLWVGEALTMFAGQDAFTVKTLKPPERLLKSPLTMLEPLDKHKEENMRRSQENIKQVIELQKWLSKSESGWVGVAANLGLDN